jgi:hypothetical protein
LPRLASAQDLLKLLGEDSAQLYQALALTPATAHLSLPTDGRGPRLRVSVSPQPGRTFRKHITVDLEGEQLRVPLEITRDFTEFKPL